MTSATGSSPRSTPTARQSRSWRRQWALKTSIFERDGEVSIGVTYMTGTLVKVGQPVAAALLGGAPFAWIPYVMLWTGLVCGAVIGATVYPLWQLQGLWFVAGLVAVLGLLVTWFDKATT